MDAKLRARLEGEYGFPDFLVICWKALGLPEPTPMQMDIAYAMQHGTRRQIVQAFRGAGKSYVCSAFVVYSLLLNPQVKILVVSASSPRAEKFVGFVLQLLDLLGPLTVHLKPRKEQSGSRVAFDVGPAVPSHSRSVYAMGILGQLTGSRADIVIGDDVESWNNSQTAGYREKILSSVAEFDSILTVALPDEKPSRILLLGTPQTEDSLYTKLNRQSYDLIVWPSRVPDKPEIYGNTLAHFVRDLALTEPVGTPVDPLRFDNTELYERELSMTKSKFQLQFQLDTTLSDADKYPLRLSDLIVMELPHEEVPEKVVYGKLKDREVTDILCWGMGDDRFYRPFHISEKYVKPTYKVMSIDPSGRGADEIGYSAVSTFAGLFYIHACNGIQGGYTDENMDILIDIGVSFGVQEFVLESNFGDGMFTKLFERRLQARNIKIACTEVRVHIQKEKRIIDTLEPLMNNHKLIISTDCLNEDLKTIRTYPRDEQRFRSLQFQMSRLSRERGSLKHDDRIDSLQLAVSRLSEFARLDTDVAIKRQNDADFDKMSKAWREGHLFTKKKSNKYNSWLT